MGRPLSAEREDEELAAVRDAATDRPATTRHGLPRRVRPDSYDGPEPPAPGAAQPDGRRRAAAHADAPAPDDARRLAASLQSGWQRREAEEEDTAAASEPWDGVEQAWTVQQHTEEEE